MVRIENWHVSMVGDIYTPPECYVPILCGQVYGHPRFPDGDDINTSDIVNVNGREVTTRSGTLYILGEPSAKYVQWCKDKGHHVPTDETPIKWNRA